MDIGARCNRDWRVCATSTVRFKRSGAVMNNRDFAAIPTHRGLRRETSHATIPFEKIVRLLVESRFDALQRQYGTRVVVDTQWTPPLSPRLDLNRQPLLKP